MSSTGTKAAAGVAAAAAAVLGGKELIQATHIAPQVVHSVPAIEAAVVKGELALEAALSGRSASNLRPTVGSSPPVGSGTLANTITSKLGDAKLDPNQNVGGFGKAVGGQADPVLNTEGFAARSGITLNYNDFRPRAASYFYAAEPRIANELSGLTPPLTKMLVEDIVKKTLAAIAEDAAKNSDAKAAFDVLSGKLTVGYATTIGGVKITAREFDVYKVATRVTVGVLACNALANANFKNCIDAAVKLAMDNALKDFKTAQAQAIAE
jgi:hypothetical protein